MLCKDAEELIKNYKMGSITAENFLLLIQHTKECPKCQATFEKAEASLGGSESGGFFSSLRAFYLQSAEKIKKKQEEKKIYTRKSFYISLILAITALAVTGMVKAFTFNSFFLIFGALIIVLTIVVFIMLFMIE